MKYKLLVDKKKCSLTKKYHINIWSYVSTICSLKMSACLSEYKYGVLDLHEPLGFLKYFILFQQALSYFG